MLSDEKEKDRLSIKKAADAVSEAASSREHLDKLEKKKLEKTTSGDNKQSKEEARLLGREGSVESVELKTKTAAAGPVKKAKDTLAVPGSAGTRTQSSVESKAAGGKSTLYESQASHDLSFFLQKERAPISPQIRFVMFQFLFTSKQLKDPLARRDASKPVL